MSLLGDRLRKARERKSLSQVEVYKRTGINNKTLSRYENGGTEPDVASLNHLANLYEVSIDWLTGINKQANNIQQLNKSSSAYNIRPYGGIMKDIAEKYPGVDLNDPDIRRKLMKMIDLVLDDYEKKQ